MSIISTDPNQLRYVLNQTHTPVAIRLGKGEKLRVKVPFDMTNRTWLQHGRRSNPNWLPDRKQWELPASWFNDFVERALRRWSKLYIVQPYNESETCAPACWNATGHDCQCSCMGARHGAGQSGKWFIASDTFAVRWGQSHLACRLMTLNGKSA